jgi:integrase/recombinase XerD
MKNPSLPIRLWPEADRAAWYAAIRQGDILDGAGPAAHWRPATKATNIHHYGRWLAFLQSRNMLETNAQPGWLCNRETLATYIDYLKETVCPVTVAGSVIGLSVMLKAMMPDQDWGWLIRTGSRLKSRARPSREKRTRLLPSEEIYRIALTELKRLRAAAILGQAGVVGFRNALMLAVIAVCPLRARNFASLQLGRTLRRNGRRWSVAIPPEEHKTGYPFNYDLADSLADFLAEYCEKVRPRLVNGPDRNFLWVTKFGKPYTPHSLYLLFCKITPRYLGRPINPHLFRDCLATTLISHSLSSAIAAAGALGHRDAQTTERFYTHAGQLEASREINRIISIISTAPN